MFNYKDSECAICNKPLKDSDDIVVCPDCGAPYHRACYVIDNVCVHALQHASGFEYQHKKAKPELADKHEVQASIVCPSCNTKNSTGNIFCESCGKPLHAGAVSSDTAANPIDNMPPPGYFGMPVINPAEEIDGIPAGDWAEYMGTSASYYLYQFKNMDIQHRKTSICWSAVLFAPLYFTYRKVWSWSAVSWLIFILAQIPSMLFMLERLETPWAMGLDQNMLINLSNVAALLLTLAEIAFGLFGIYLYRRWTGKHLRNMRAKAASNEEYHQKLSRRKGPSIAAVVVTILALSVALGVFVTYAIGPEIINDLMGVYQSVAAV